MTRGGGQLSLGGLGGAVPTDRLFFAVFPDAATATRIAGVARQLRAGHGLRGTPVREDRLHVTLHHLGDFAGLPGDLVARAQAAAGGIVLAAFDVMLDKAASFAGRASGKPFVLRGDDGNAPLHALHEVLADALRAAGLTLHRGRRFVPHVTLLYDDTAVAGEAVPPIAWHVREFALVHSLLGRTEHRVLGRWPLSG